MNQNAKIVQTVTERKLVFPNRLSDYATGTTLNEQHRSLICDIAKSVVWDAGVTFRSFHRDRAVRIERLQDLMFDALKRYKLGCAEVWIDQSFTFIVKFTMEGRHLYLHLRIDHETQKTNGVSQETNWRGL